MYDIARALFYQVPYLIRSNIIRRRAVRARETKHEQMVLYWNKPTVAS